MTALEAAETAIYALLSLPLLLILYRHGLPSALGWFYLIAFCLLRVVGNVMSLSGNAIGVIVANVGISPLLLGAFGVLHEARVYRFPGADRKLEWVAVLGFHALATGGVALLAVGAAGMVGSDPQADDGTLEKIGVVALLAAWGFLCGGSVLSLRIGMRSSVLGNKRAGKMLLGTVLVADLFIGIAVLYAVITIFRGTLIDGDEPLAVEVIFSVVPEMLAVVIFIVGGLLTRNASREMDTEKGDNYRLSQQHGMPFEGAGYP